MNAGLLKRNSQQLLGCMEPSPLEKGGCLQGGGQKKLTKVLVMDMMFVLKTIPSFCCFYSGYLMTVFDPDMSESEETEDSLRGREVVLRLPLTNVIANPGAVGPCWTTH